MKHWNQRKPTTVWNVKKFTAKSWASIAFMFNFFFEEGVLLMPHYPIQLTWLGYKRNVKKKKLMVTTTWCVWL